MLLKNPSIPRVLFLFVSSFSADKEHLSEHGAEGGESKSEICRKKSRYVESHTHKVNGEKRELES
jgi:general stress protein YciG